MSNRDPRFEDALTDEGHDLTQSAAERPAVRFREREVAQVLAALLRRRSVVLLGPHGAGRTSVVHALAAHVAGLSGEQDWLQSIVEFPASHFLTNTRFIGEWETKTDAVLRGAESDGVCLFVPDVWNLSMLGRTSNTNHNVLAQLRPALQSGRLVLIGEATPEQFAAMESGAGARGLFEVVHVSALTREQSGEIIAKQALVRGLGLDEAALTVVRDLCARFLPRAPSPGPELNLLEQMADYRDEKVRAGEPTLTNAAFVEKVFSIHSGLPAFVIAQGVTCQTADVRQYFTDRIVGQRAAIEAVVEMITLFKAGLNDPTKPIGSFLFVGPTGVGKTELARTLAAFLFGSTGRLLRFDLSELKDYLGFQLLVGSPNHPEQAPRLLSPVRAQPFQVVLFDELEKAHANVWDLLLPLLDEGHLTSAAGERVDFRSTILICTSNVGAATGAGAHPERSVGFAAPQVPRTPAEIEEARVRHALEAEFRPEFLNRFQSIVVFHPLSAEDVRTIARQDLVALVTRDGLIRRHVSVTVDDSAIDLAALHGFDARYGARALKREIQHRITLPLARTLMEREPPPGSVLHVFARDGQIQVRVEDSDESVRWQREHLPATLEDGRKLRREDAARWATGLRQAHAALSQRIDVPSLRARWSTLSDEAQDADFWRDAARAARLTQEREHLRGVLDALDRVDSGLGEISASLATTVSRGRLAQLGGDLARNADALLRTFRDLFVFGQEGAHDAMLWLAPVAGPHGAMAVDHLARIYLRWASARDVQVTWICEPRSADEPVVLALQGERPFRLLRGEAGLHRVRRDEDSAGAVTVRVLPWLGPWTPDAGTPAPPPCSDRRPIKGVGRFDGKLRSRLKLPTGPLIQNARTLTQNELLLPEVWLAFASQSTPQTPTGEEVVRRYDLEPARYRDTLLAEQSARTDCLGPDALHELLHRRADRLSGAEPLPGLGRGPTGPLK